MVIKKRLSLAPQTLLHFIAFEERYNLAITTIQSDPRLTYLSFIVWNSLRRAKRTDKSFEDFVETLDTISGDDADPKV